MLISKILTCILFKWKSWGFLLAAKDYYYDGPAYKEGRAAILERGVCLVTWHALLP